ncbi:potassium-transporting ATPase subunit KdpA [bacterium]|nr:potassium-transporting ATPase subunit KdpA [bacterium]
MGVFQIIAYLAVLLALAWPLGVYMAAVYGGRRTVLSPVLGPLERLFYRAGGINPDRETSWKSYALAMLVFNAGGLLIVYLLQRFQGVLPLNPAERDPVGSFSALNVAISFATNTNWQNYGGEGTMSYLTQMVGLGVQNFLSAATGMAVMAALARGFVRKQCGTIGNFWADMTRSTLYILLPLSIVLSVVLVSQGVVQTFQPYHELTTLTGESQTIAVGPAASQIAIKQLGTNGGGFFNVNSAHPLENPTPLSNFLQLLAILLIPAAFCITFGKMVRDERQGWLLLTVMTVFLAGCLAVTAYSEQQGNPLLEPLSVTQKAMEAGEGPAMAGGNMEGKEVRFGIANSALWAVATTAASNGSVNSMHDSYTPLGGMIPMWLMQLGEIIFGGVGSGLYGLLMVAIVAVFAAGLMVGRTPEYIGKKIGPFEMKMASLAILFPSVVTLAFTAIALLTSEGTRGISNPGPHGLSQVLYAFSSMGNNNGSAFAGYGANTDMVNILGGIAMLVARYWVMLPALAVAGALASKRQTPPSQGTLPTHTPLFGLLLIVTILAIGALTFLPALALGPIVEHLILKQGGL